MEFLKLDLSRIEGIAYSNEQLHILFANRKQNLEIKSIPVSSRAIEELKDLAAFKNSKTVTLPSYTPPTPVSLSSEEIGMINVTELKAGRSDTIKAIGYHPKQEILQVRFNDDATYQYYQVPYGGFLNFLTSDSLGKFFNQFIKNRFEFQRVD